MVGIVVAFMAGITVGSSGASTPAAPTASLSAGGAPAPQQLVEPASAPDVLEPDAAPTAPTTQVNEVGSTVVNGGIAITVKAIRTTDTIQMNESNFGRDRATRATPRHQPAQVRSTSSSRPTW
ncbi:hypothetical protein [Pseudonocardia charpentierae]|uniref:Uncharacterized protein n=1 Tax=Pseudonocardia charpentierae TaxID=3075545 RepID=A0ABU2NHX1_9PSEU|nr:hypothetical protein [Pseudonocardia sp. DSM 45834]MDT0353068.1 hypothetical protein [Pseudonocardia sp. DSM 45834]